MLIKKGMSGEVVKCWREFLTAQGFELEEGNYFGDSTEDFTRQFQARAGLTPDGLVGELTLDAAYKLGFDISHVPERKLILNMLDVSHYQSFSDFQAVKDSGIVGLIHKGTECTHYKEKQYFSRRDAWLNIGGLWGAYCFVSNDNTDIQDDYFLNYIEPDNDTIDNANTLIAIDFEDYNIPIYKIEKWVQEVYDRLGRYPYLYTGAGLVKGRVKADSILMNCKIWWAAYLKNQPTVPFPLQDMTFWQYSCKGRISGIVGNVDLNYYCDNGTPIEEVWAK